MPGVQVGNLHRKRIVRKLSGEIIDWVDQTDGGNIIQKGQVVNQEKIEREAKKEEDRREAALAPSKAVDNGHREERNNAPSRMDELEQKVAAVDGKLDAILAALKK